MSIALGLLLLAPLCESAARPLHRSPRSGPKRRAEFSAEGIAQAELARP